MCDECGRNYHLTIDRVCSHGKSEVEMLQKKLHIAIRALKFVAMPCDYKGDDLKSYQEVIQNDTAMAKRALKKIRGKNE